MHKLRSTVILINGGVSQIQITGNKSYYLKIGVSFILSLIIILGWLIWFIGVQPREIAIDLVEAIGFSSRVIIIILKVLSFIVIEWLRGG